MIFMREHKLINFVIVLFIIISCFLLYQQLTSRPVEKIKKESVSVVNYQENKQTIKTVNDYFSPIRQIKNKMSNDYLFVFQKNVSDFSNGNYQYFIKIDEDKIKLSTLINNEHLLVLKAELDSPLINNYQIVIDDKTHEQVYTYDFTKAEQKTLDISQITSELTEKHELLENEVIIIQSQLEEIKRRIKTLENDSINLAKIDIKSESDKKVINDSQAKIKQDIKDYEQQIEQLTKKFDDKQAEHEKYEELFIELFGIKEH